jgi:hypothetical protein
MGRRTDCLGSLVMHYLNYLRGAFLTSLATAKMLSANERQRVPFEARGFITQTSRAITAGKKLIRHAAWTPLGFPRGTGSGPSMGAWSWRLVAFENFFEVLGLQPLAAPRKLAEFTRAMVRANPSQAMFRGGPF